MLNSPRSTPAEALTGGIWGRDPTGQPYTTPAELRPAGFRRRRGLRPRGEHQRAPRGEAHPGVPSDWPEDDRSTPDERAWRQGGAARCGQAAPVR